MFRAAGLPALSLRPIVAPCQRSSVQRADPYAPFLGVPSSRCTNIVPPRQHQQVVSPGAKKTLAPAAEPGLLMSIQVAQANLLTPPGLAEKST